MLLGAAFAAPSLSPLRAQDAVLRALRDPEDPDAPPAVLWIVDGRAGTPLADGFVALLQAPELRAYQVPLKAGRMDGAMLDALRRHGLAASPQWFLVDARADRVLANGLALPKAGAFAQTLEGAGFRDRGKDLQDYLKRNPDSLEVRDRWLRVLRTRGEAEAQRLGGSVADSAPAKPLGPVQDLEAWSAFTQELDSDFSSGRWREMDMAWLREARAFDDASPTLQGLYLRWMPTVEAALREDPTSDPLWALWAWMSGATGGRRLGPLLASLRPSPLTPPSAWPPQAAARLMMAAAKTPADWMDLKRHYEAVWEDGSHPLLDKSAGAADLPLAQDWADALAPLLECCLRSGASQQADALVRNAFAATRWPSLPAKASALAARCGDKALASRWASLGGAR